MVPRRPGRAIKHRGKSPGTADKGDGKRFGGMRGGGMATGRQAKAEQAFALRRPAVQQKLVSGFARCQIGRAADLGPRHAGQAGCRQSGKKGAARGHLSHHPPR